MNNGKSFCFVCFVCFVSFVLFVLYLVVSVSHAPAPSVRVPRNAVGHDSVHVGTGALTGIAVAVKAAANLCVINSRGDLRVKVGTLATEARVAAHSRLLKAAGNLSGVAFHVLIETVCAITAATWTIEEATLLGLTIFIQLDLLVAKAGLFAAHGHRVNHLMRTCAFVVSPVKHRGFVCLLISLIFLCLESVLLHLELCLFSPFSG
jgi:hypothetical protein